MTTPSATDHHRQPAGTRWHLDPHNPTAEFRVRTFWDPLIERGRFDRLDGRLEVDEHGRRRMVLAIDAASLRSGPQI